MFRYSEEATDFGRSGMEQDKTPTGDGGRYNKGGRAAVAV